MLMFIIRAQLSQRKGKKKSVGSFARVVALSSQIIICVCFMSKVSSGHQAPVRGGSLFHSWSYYYYYYYNSNVHVCFLFLLADLSLSLSLWLAIFTTSKVDEVRGSN